MGSTEPDPGPPRRLHARAVADCAGILEDVVEVWGTPLPDELRTFMRDGLVRAWLRGYDSMPGDGLP